MTFKPGDSLDPLPLSREEAQQLISGGYALSGGNAKQTETLKSQLMHLYYPDDGVGEMALDLIDPPQAPCAPRPADWKTPLPPLLPIPGKRTRFGQLYEETVRRKNAVQRRKTK